ncbi:hypothetical protein BJF95_09770 [Rhizobium oryziradicis]|uniref:Uncharacterized protein n=1 Tax=Rhizobium oryziradicis TaxID=1867956 RepID=A0A1Q8ZRS3_9HYPH|nr:hypothetical protein BJF95_09770 [Rhizobium oryziradicis]
MRHRRGIDLTVGNNDNLPPKPSGIKVPERDHSATLADLPQWYVIGGKCGRCGNVSLLDRWELERKLGKFRSIISMEPLLRCSRCGNNQNNSFVLGRAKRD